MHIEKTGCGPSGTQSRPKPASSHRRAIVWMSRGVRAIPKADRVNGRGAGDPVIRPTLLARVSPSSFGPFWRSGRPGRKSPAQRPACGAWPAPGPATHVGPVGGGLFRPPGSAFQSQLAGPARRPDQASGTRGLTDAVRSRIARTVLHRRPSDDVEGLGPYRADILEPGTGGCALRLGSTDPPWLMVPASWRPQTAGRCECGTRRVDLGMARERRARRFAGRPDR